MSTIPSLAHLPAEALIVESVEALRGEGRRLVRVRSRDGAVGLAPASERLDYLWPILAQRVAPYFISRDARDVGELVEGVYLHQSNYKLAGLALWCCVGWVEGALLDLLGKVAGKPVYELLGGPLRTHVAVYLSSMRRDSAPEEEVGWLGERLERTGARAVKIKIGGRMSRNADAAPGRSERLVRLARETFGEALTLYADANGSYDAEHAVEVGRMLADHGVAFLEEPCPWEDYDATRAVTAALDLPVAGGEQDSSLLRFRDMIARRVVDILQPDLNYNGGLLRTVRVAALAAQHNIPVTPHSPRSDANQAVLLHFAACTPNVGPFHEYDAAQVGRPPWCAPALQVTDGKIEVPSGPGWGLEYPPELVAACETLCRT